MIIDHFARQAYAKAEALAIPIDQIDPSNPQYFVDDTVEHYFARLRRDDPVHKSHSPVFGDYWSVTRYQDIVNVDSNHQVFSSQGGITLFDSPTEFRLPNFISMDPPKRVSSSFVRGYSELMVRIPQNASKLRRASNFSQTELAH